MGFVNLGCLFERNEGKHLEFGDETERGDMAQGEVAVTCDFVARNAHNSASESNTIF